VVLMALKTLELRARRDALVVFFLGFFLVLTNFLYSQSLLVALSMLVSVWGLLTALVLAHMPVGKPPLRAAGTLAARSALLGAPLMVLLFRCSRAWRRCGACRRTAAGAPACRARCDGRRGRPGQRRQHRHARALLRPRARRRPDVLPRAGAGRLRRPRMDPLGRQLRLSHRLRNETRLFGAPVDYEVTLEPSRLPLLPLLEITPDRPDAAPESDRLHADAAPDAQWQADRPVADRLRVRAKAWTEHRHGPRRPTNWACATWWRCPPATTRAACLGAGAAQQPGAGRRRPARLADALLAHMRDNEFTYTLEPGSYGRHAVDEFWFDRKLGFCEHFAAAFVVMLRAMDVPARIVTGYQGTDPSPVDGYHVVRQSHAHAWAEYWQPGDGWVRVDPTAAVAPDRIRSAATCSRRAAWWPGAGQRQPGHGAAAAAGLGSAEQPLEPVGAELFAQQQFDLLRAPGLQRPGLGRPELPADRPAVQPAAWPAPAGRCGTATGRTPGSACSSAWPGPCVRWA
jgi:transglutaminase-like putative cysteine protease